MQQYQDKGIEEKPLKSQIFYSGCHAGFNTLGAGYETNNGGAGKSHEYTCSSMHSRCVCENIYRQPQKE